MKIKIENIPDTYNYGSLMMAVNTIKYINDNIKNVEFYVDTLTDKDLNRLKSELGSMEVYKASTFSEVDNLKKINRFISRINKESEFYDAKILLGGDDISEYYGKKHWLTTFPLMYLKAKKINTILLGQTIGPFTGYRKILCRIALNKTKIYTRDDKCFNYLKGLGINTIEKGRDLAFMELPNKDNKGMSNKYNLKKNNYITVVPSGLSNLYTKDYRVYISEMIKIIEDLLIRDDLKDKKIVLLSHVLMPKHDDRVIIKEIVNKIGTKYKERIVPIYDEMLSSEARYILANGIFTITGRMHPAVSTFYMGKPSLTLSYSVKYEGVIGEGLGMSDLIIEAHNDEMWKTGEISELVANKVNYILDNYDDLIKNIDINVNKVSAIVENQLGDLVIYLKSI